MATRASSTLGSRLVLSTFYDILCKLRSGRTAANVREAERQVDVSSTRYSHWCLRATNIDTATLIII